MRVICRHGHFAFYPRTSTDVSRFADYWRITLTRVEDYFTFPALATLPRYSFAGKSYLNLTAVKTYEGRHPWDVMRENGFVYHIASQALFQKNLIAVSVNPVLSQGFWVPPTALVQPGSRDKTGQIILSYSGEYNLHFAELKISEFSYV